MRSMVLVLLVTARQTASPSHKTTHESPGRATWKRGPHDTTAQKQRALLPRQEKRRHHRRNGIVHCAGWLLRLVVVPASPAVGFRLKNRNSICVPAIGVHRTVFTDAAVGIGEELDDYQNISASSRYSSPVASSTKGKPNLLDVGRPWGYQRG
jgi:hypothetical protein